MPWVLLDVVIALLAVALLALVLLRLWRGVKALFGTAKEAGAALGAASGALSAAQASAPDRSGAPAYPGGTSNEERV